MWAALGRISHIRFVGDNGHGGKAEQGTAHLIAEAMLMSSGATEARRHSAEAGRDNADVVEAL